MGKEKKIKIIPVEVEEENGQKEAFVGERIALQKISPWTSVLLKIPLIGRKVLEKKVKQGFVIAEVIMPNQTSMFYLVDTRFNAFTHRVSDKKEKLFIIDPIKKEPERYVRYLNGFPVVTFNWKSGLPVPIDPKKEVQFDEDYFCDIVMRARLIGGSEKLIDWLNNTLKIMHLILAVAGANLLFQILRWMQLI